ncbi:MAG: SHOCT domain-containing protein [Actinomycetota bacterium]
MPCPGCGPWMIVPWILFLAVIAVGIILLARTLWTRDGGSNRSRERGEPRQERHALGVLEERYARGEIDRDEFEERRRILGG